MLPRRFALALALAVPMSLPLISLATPPTDDAIDALIRKVESAKPEGEKPAAAAVRQARRDAAAEALKATPLSEASIGQIQRIFDKRIVIGNNELMEAIDARLVELAKAPGADGARAIEYRIQCVAPATSPEGRERRNEKIGALAEEALQHPGAADLFKSGGGDGVVRAAAGLSPDAMQDHKIFERLAPFITTDLSPSAAMALSSLIEPLVGAKESLGQAKFDSIRASIAKAAEAATDKAVKIRDEHAAKLAAEPKKEGDEGEKAAKSAELAKQTDDRQITILKGIQATASGAWMRDELVGHAAPAISFVWSNTEKPIHSFADLKGKVVLIDFWATWCGPCVAAFPKMRELQSRYAGYPVVILGVTSDQGYSIDRTDRKKPVKIDCAGDPAKEHGLMTEFMKTMEMTWSVAFSEQNVFNPDFGVHGIPHMAIIDSNGVVRHGHLFPPDPKEESEKIDALLKEAKLPYPENPYVEPPKNEDKKDEPKKG